LGMAAIVFEKLVKALDKLISMERTAYGMDRKTEASGDTLEAWLTRLSAKRAAGRTFTVESDDVVA